MLNFFINNESVPLYKAGRQDGVKDSGAGGNAETVDCR